MKKLILISLVLFLTIIALGQNKIDTTEFNSLKKEVENLNIVNDSLQEKIENIEIKNKITHNNYNNLDLQYQQANDRLDNYLTYTGIIAAIFGVLIALAGIYIGFESLRSQNRTKDAIKTLEDAKNYVNDKKTGFDDLIAEKKNLLQSEYEKITKVIKDKLLSDIEIETSKVREIAEKKTEEIQSLSAEQQTNKTIELLEKRLEFFENVGIPDDPEILFSKSKILREKKMHKEAILLLEKLIEKVPLHKHANWYLGFEYAILGDNENSIKYYKRQIELDPSDSSAMNNIALRYKVKGQLLDALEYLSKAIDISDKVELYIINRIDVLLKLKSIDRAMDDYTKLQSLNPDNVKNYDEAIKILKNENRIEAVIENYDRAINHFKDKEPEICSNFSFRKAAYFGENGKEKEAIEIFQSLIDNNYKIDNCYMNIADLKSKIGESKEAIQILTNGISKNPLSSSLYIYKAFIESINKEDAAKLTLEEGGKMIKTESFYFSAGSFFHLKEKINMAKHCYEKALEIIETKINTDKFTEGDFMNYYETLIILQKPLTEFNEKYRNKIISEKYLIVLSVLEVLNKIYLKSISKDDALKHIKELNIEAKDKDLIKWNFNDITRFIENTKDKEMSTFVQNVVKYIKREINFGDI